MPDNKPAKRTYDYNKEYVKRYMAKQAVVKLYTTPEQKEALTAAARAAGESVNQYILTAAQDRMNRDNQNDE